MLDAALISHCKNLACTVAPELSERPLYVVSTALFEGLPQPSGCLGWADRYPTMFDFRERIGSDWKGPGPIIALDGAAIASEWGAEHFRDGALNTLLHEVAHLLPADTPREDFADLFDTPTMRDWQRSKAAETVALPDPEAGTPADFHGPEFIRIATHLWGRARLAGWDIPSDHLFGGSCWYLSQPAHWLCALLREVVTMQFAPFSEIVSTDPPQGFTAMFDGALRFHFHRESCTKETKP